MTLNLFAAGFVPFAVLTSAALLAPETTTSLERFRTIYTIYSTMLLMLPAIFLFPFRTANAYLGEAWRMFWTFAFLAYALHVYWAIFVFFGGVHETFRGQGPLIASVNFLFTALWSADVLLTWSSIRSSAGVRIVRGITYLAVLAIFVLTTIVLRPTPIAKSLGMALVLASTVSWVLRALTAERQTKQTNPASTV